MAHIENQATVTHDIACYEPIDSNYWYIIGDCPLYCVLHDPSCNNVFIYIITINIIMKIMISFNKKRYLFVKTYDIYKIYYVHTNNRGAWSLK